MILSEGCGTVRAVERIAVVETPEGGFRLRALDRPDAPTEQVTDPAALDRPGVRWVWADTAAIYPKLLAAGVRVTACHDAALTEALLSGHDGRWGEPRALRAAWARLTGAPVPKDPPVRERDTQPTLFEPFDDGVPAGVDALDALVAVHAAQLDRMPDAAFRLLVAVESAGALAAAEMGHVGLPWRADVHDALLVELLGERAGPGMPPRRLTELAAQVVAALGGPVFHVDSPAEVIRAFARVGIRLPSTRSWVLKDVDHPAIAPLLAYKELYRLYVAHGWNWLDTWVSAGRFRAEYVAGGVVTGRWATRGGAALQIPKVVRRAVVADPGHVLVCADAGQLEPRILAAMAGDRRLAEAARDADLYARLAAEAFGGDRQRAKIGMLAAMYGQTSGEAAAPLATLRRRFPVALECVEQAARAGEEGRLVRSRLGRTCPSPSVGWWGAVGEVGGGEGLSAESGAGDPVLGGGPGRADEQADTGGRDGGSRARARGRFTRNFVVQATAAEWALALVAGLRRELMAIDGAELVFFQHDEVIVHCPAGVAERVTAAVTEAARRAGELLFGDTPVLFPVGAAVVDSYADAK
ncbi:bifunctional 3'-5' exonuclease/DNA polymerase [Longispora sp. K20-0274]|uniref:bifunctional 3'-5' exonuclease/DNA polymerase n=1 Tax=Longispora sp. K20-0274 TaxID=3088255 RepID=UPI003999D924